MGGTSIAIPYSTGLTLFTVLCVVQAISSGGYLTAQVVWIIEIWKDAAGPYIQAQHFFFALGTIFPPLIFAPYLSSNSDLDDIDMLTTNSTVILENVAPAINELQKLYVPCAICGSIIVFGGVLLLGNFYAFYGMSPTSTTCATESQEIVIEPTMTTDAKKNEIETEKAEGDDSEENNTNPKTKSLINKFVLIILASLLIGGVESMEGISMTFLPVFGHYSDLHLSKADGANILSAYSIAYTVARLLGVVIILRLHARWILCGNIVIIALANLVLLFIGGTNLTTMYIGTILLGIGFSTSVPSVFAYAQLHLHVTNIIGSILMVAGGTLAAVFPVVVGSFIEVTPSILMYLNLGCVVVCLVCLCSMVISMRNTVGKL